MTTCSPLFIKSTRTSNSAARDKSGAIDWPYFGFVVKKPQVQPAWQRTFVSTFVYSNDKSAHRAAREADCQAETLRPVCMSHSSHSSHRLISEPYISLEICETSLQPT